MKPRRRLRVYNRVRLWFVVGCFGLSFLTMLGYLFHIQIIKHKVLRDYAVGQYMRRVILRPERGHIVDRQGRVLATSAIVPSIYAIPYQIEQPDETAAVLAPLLESAPTTLQALLSSKKPFVWLARQVAPEIAAQVAAAQLRGIHIQDETRRYYPKEHLAGQILGFVGIDGHGLGGIEYEYDSFLVGQPRRVTLQRDARRRQLGLDSGGTALPPRGADVHLTLDEWLQHLAEREIAAQVREVKAHSGLVLMLQPQSGDILAIASYPFFNPNTYRDASQYAWRRNRAVTDPVEPGSTFKLVVAAAALEEKTVQPAEEFYCEKGLFYRGRRRIRDHHPYEWLDFRGVFQHSSNICTIKINERLSAFRFYQYIRRFGFGEKTLVGLPAESPGQLRPPPEWSGFSQDSLSIGQEIAVTPLQLLMAYAAVANGGVLMRPRIVHRIDTAPPAQLFPPYERWRVLEPETAQQLKAILRAVVSEGTGKLAALEGYDVAGKTGTAQKVEPGDKHYSVRRVIASFIGFVPVEDPQLVMLVMLNEPQKARWGGQAAAPVFRRIAQEALPYLRVPPQLTPPLAGDTEVKQAAAIPTGPSSKPWPHTQPQLVQTRR